MHEILNFPFCYDKTHLFYAEIKICTILNFYDIKQQITYLKQIDPDLKIFSPNPFYTNESLSRTDFPRTVRYPGRYPSMQWSLLLLFLVEEVRKKIYQSKSIPDVHKFVLRSKMFSAGSLTKSYVKEINSSKQRFFTSSLLRFKDGRHS